METNNQKNNMEINNVEINNNTPFINNLSENLCVQNLNYNQGHNYYNENNNNNKNINDVANLNTNIEIDSNVDSDSDSDSDEYIDLSANLELGSESIYQFVINENKLELKYIGKFTKAPDIIIKEKFGPDSNMSLYSCVYTFDELTKTKSDELFFPLVKLITQKEFNIIITCIAIKLNNIIDINKNIEDWELYWLENKSDLEHIKMCKIEKNINPSNIIEKLIGYSVNN